MVVSNQNFGIRYHMEDLFEIACDIYDSGLFLLIKIWLVTPYELGLCIFPTILECDFTDLCDDANSPPLSDTGSAKNTFQNQPF